MVLPLISQVTEIGFAHRLSGNNNDIGVQHGEPLQEAITNYESLLLCSIVTSLITEKHDTNQRSRQPNAAET